MEPLTLLFLLLMQSPDLRENLRSFLSFYRENRDLLSLFLQNGAPMSEKEPEKNRPPEEVGIHADASVLEQMLLKLR